MDVSTAENYWRYWFAVWLILSAFATCDLLLGEPWPRTAVIVVFALVSLAFALDAEGIWRRQSWSGFSFVNSLGASIGWAALLGSGVLIGFLMFGNPVNVTAVAVTHLILFFLGATLALADYW